MRMAVDDDFFETVPIVRRSPQRVLRATPLSSRITRSQLQNIVTGKGKTIFLGCNNERIGDKRSRNLQLDDDINGGLEIRTKKNVRRKVKVVKPDIDVVPQLQNLKIWDFYTPREKHANRCVSVHCNNKIFSEIKQRLTGGLYERFKATCFGHLLEMPAFHVQNQLLVALLFREVVPPTHDALYFVINGKRLRFGIREFALVTGLRCEGDVLKDYSSGGKNRIVEKYFGSAERVSKADLEKCFQLKNWDNDDDAIKITALYVINTFLYSTKNDEKQPHLIDDEHFDIVESGAWESYPWGSKVFLATIRSMHNKVHEVKSMYRFAGLPYALLVWFYECCPTVNGKLATRVGHNIPRILNWEVTKQVRYFQELQKGFFSQVGNEMVVDNIFPTELELSILNLPQEKAIDVEEIHRISDHEIPDNDTEEQQDLGDDDFIRKEYFMKELEKIKQNQVDIKNDIHSVSKDVIVLKELMVATVDRIFMELSEIAKKVAGNGVQEADMEGNFSFGGFGSDNEIIDDEQMRTKKNLSVTAASNDNLNVMEALDKEATTSAKGPSKNTSVLEIGSLENATGVHTDVEGSHLDHISTQDLVIIDELTEKHIIESGKRKAAANNKDVSQREFPNFRLFGTQEEEELFGNKNSGSAKGNCSDNFHENLNVASASQEEIVPQLNHPTEVTPPVQRAVRTMRLRRPARFIRSAFINTNGDSGSGSQLPNKSYFSVKHPFSTNIWRSVDQNLSSNFTAWIKRGLRKTRAEPYNNSVNILKPKFDFGVCLVDNKDWFHTLHYAETPLQETHLDVILYYLRKKSRYDPRVRARFATTDCLFDSYIRELWKSYLGNNRSLTVYLGNHIISDYMKGSSIRCNTPWRLVDDVLFPIKVVDDWHWVLGRLSFKDRVIYVYDSKLDNCFYDKEIIEAVEPYCVLIPFFLCAIDFYETRTDLRPEKYTFGPVPNSDKFELLHIYDMDGVPKNDYGVFAAAFAEHFIHARGMPDPGCKINKYRRRYGALLWDYGLSKQASNLESDPEDM